MLLLAKFNVEKLPLISAQDLYHMQCGSVQWAVELLLGWAT